jgi:hypothetical protein
MSSDLAPPIGTLLPAGDFTDTALLADGIKPCRCSSAQCTGIKGRLNSRRPRVFSFYTKKQTRHARAVSIKWLCRARQKAKIKAVQTWYFCCHCEERSDEAIHFLGDYGLLRYARNDKENTKSEQYNQSSILRFRPEGNLTSIFFVGTINI